MTPELKHRLTDHIEALTAFRDGTATEFEFFDGEEWLKTHTPLHEFRDMSLTADWHRIKRKPKLRPWKPEEVPVPLVIRIKGSATWKIATEIEEHGIYYPAGHKLYVVGYAKLLADFEHSTDGGKTWKPCGVGE